MKAAQFSPDGTKIVTADSSGAALIWKMRPAGTTRPALRHNGSVRSARFSADGRRVITASTDQTARIWDARSGRELA